MSEQVVVPDKMVPHNVEAEQAVLGALLIDPDAIYKVNTFVHPNDFYVERHQWIYDAVLSLHERREAVDFVTLCDELERNERLAELGGAAYLSALIDSTPTALNIEHYAHIVERTSTLRRLIGAAGEIAALAYQDTDDVGEVVDRAEQILFGVSQRRVSGDMQIIRDVVSEYYDRVDYLYQHKGETIGVPTGFRNMDKILGGWQKSDLVIIAARPSMGKCVTADTRLVDPTTGQVTAIEDLVRQGQANLLTLGDDLKLQPAQASRFLDDGQKPVFRVRTALGREIKTTLTHPFRTLDGWHPLGELHVGDLVAVPRTIPVFGQHDVPEHEAKVLAYLLADGCVVGRTPQFTNADPRLREDFTSAALQFPGTKKRVGDNNGTRTPTVYISHDAAFVAAGRKRFAERLTRMRSARTQTRVGLAQAIGVTPGAVRSWESAANVPTREHYDQLVSALEILPEDLAPEGIAAIGKKSPNSLTEWLQEQGLWQKAAAQKCVPAAVYEYTRPKLALFLNRLFACDGSVYIQQGKQAVISYSTVSYQLAQDVQHLLLRFGIIAKLRDRKIRYGTGTRQSYQLRITGIANLERFVDKIGAFGKEPAIEQVKVYIQQTDSNTNLDTIPIEVWDEIAEIKGERTWRSIYEEMGLPPTANIHAGKRAPSRERLLAIARALGSEHLAQLAQSDVYWDRIVSIEPLGLRQVYDLTVPDTHNFCANDMIVHNTSLMLSVAQNAARKYNQRVALFSLEMSAEQLVQRLISAETGIESQRLRIGNLREDEWPTFIQATGALSETMVFIDDTPSISAMQVRTKARRLYAEYGLDLLIIDYLQLMQSDRRTENRVQEISFLSRALKGLARELNIPVIVGSQLSRAVEQRNDKRPMLSDLRESGCLVGSTLVQMADGHRVPIRSLAQDGLQANILALNEQTWQIESVPARKAWETGTKPVFRLKTQLGHEIRATANHRFRTLDGWKRLDQIDVDDHIALPRSGTTVAPTSASLTKNEVALLGHLIGDGCTLPRHAVQYTTSEHELAKTVVDLATEVFGQSISPRIERQRTWWQVFLSSAERLTHQKRNPVAAWLDELGVWGYRSHEKRVPTALFGQPGETIAYFLRHLWATDGTLGVFGQKNPRALAYYSSSSELLARDVQHLLRRLGIIARVHSVSQGDKGRDQWHVTITGKPDLLTFVDQVGVVGPKKARLEEIREFYRDRVHNTNRDVIPRSAWRLIVEPARQALGLSQRAMQAAMGMQYCGTSLFRSNLGRDRALQVSQIVQSPQLERLARSDVYWDQVVSVEPDGTEDVYDVEVPGHHNFLANDIVVHNSIEQDADIVMFIYRDDYYTPESETPNIAEIIISKHRNGPTGVVPLYFKKELAQFLEVEMFREDLEF